MANTGTKTAPISLTEGAIKQLTAIKKEQNISDEHGLRVGVKGGGCAGFTYVLGFDVKKENDEIYPLNEDLYILLNKSHALYLIGMEIDFVDGLSNRGFTFTNPNATENCGCGTSFNA